MEEDKVCFETTGRSGESRGRMTVCVGVYVVEKCGR